MYPTGLLGFGDVRRESEGRDMRVELVLRGGAREVEVGGRCGYASIKRWCRSKLTGLRRLSGGLGSA